MVQNLNIHTVTATRATYNDVSLIQPPVFIRNEGEITLEKIWYSSREKNRQIPSNAENSKNLQIPSKSNLPRSENFTELLLGLTISENHHL